MPLVSTHRSLGSPYVPHNSSLDLPTSSLVYYPSFSADICVYWATKVAPLPYAGPVYSADWSVGVAKVILSWAALHGARLIPPFHVTHVVAVTSYYPRTHTMRAFNIPSS
jgi:hypothetical protein